METIVNSFLLLLMAFLGGIVSSLSPCTIALLPLILAYVCGTKETSTTNLALKLFSFSVGLSSILGIIGILCAITGKVFGGFNSGLLLIIFGSVMMALGLQLIGVIDVQMPQIVKKIPQTESTSLFWYPFLIGVLFAFLSSPCSSPILLGIMAVATASSDYLTSFLMLFLFAFGQCIVIVLAGLFASFLKNLQKLQKYTNTLIKLSGWLFIIFAIGIWLSVYLSILTRF